MTKWQDLLQLLKQHRNQRLTIVYFWPLGKSRTLELTPARFWALISCALAVTVWSIFAGLWTLRNYVAIHDLQTELQLARQSVFAYQASYENVFEEAYPDAAGAVSPKAAPEPAPAIQVVAANALAAANVEVAAPAMAAVAAAKEEAPAPAVAAAKEEAPAPVVAATQEEAPAPAALAEPKIEAQPQLAFQTPKATYSEQTLRVQFGLMNSQEGSKVRGYLYAIARVEQPDGKSAYLGSAPNLAIDPQTGKATRPTKGESFAIRRYRAGNLHIPLPAAFTGSVKDIWLVAVDAQGNALLEKEVSTSRLPRIQPIVAQPGAAAVGDLGGAANSKSM